jgi:hypothetical protein
MEESRTNFIIYIYLTQNISLIVYFTTKQKKKEIKIKR